MLFSYSLGSRRKQWGNFFYILSLSEAGFWKPGLWYTFRVKYEVPEACIILNFGIDPTLLLYSVVRFLCNTTYNLAVKAHQSFSQWERPRERSLISVDITSRQMIILSKRSQNVLNGSKQYYWSSWLYFILIRPLGLQLYFMACIAAFHLVKLFLSLLTYLALQVHFLSLSFSLFNETLLVPHAVYYRSLFKPLESWPAVGRGGR